MATNTHAHDHHVSDRELLKLARAILPDAEFQVWFAKHYQSLGRRTGSIRLGISEEAWRYRLSNATRKLDQARSRQEDTAA